MKLEDLEKGNVQFAILIILLALYLLTKSPLIGFLTGLTIVGLFIVELYVGAKREGWKEELKELAFIAVGALILWYGLKLVLHTDTPITAVVSCSMLPSVQRGDLLIVKGPPVEAGYELEVPYSDVRALSQDPVVVYGNESISVEGSLYSYCLGNPSPLCVEFVRNPQNFEEVRGNFTFHYSRCWREWADTGEKKAEVCVSSITYANRTYPVERKGDVVVYRPAKGTLFSLYGDIVHRAVVELKTEKESFYLTKGDNNNIFDVQFYSGLYGLRNYPVSEGEVLGKALFRIPFLGYYKLFLSMYVEEEDLCKAILVEG